MDSRLGLLAVAIVVVVVIGIGTGGGWLTGGDDQPSGGEGGEVAEVTDGVDWQNHSPTVKIRIDSMAASGDCAGLQFEFDTAEANSDMQRARTGDGNADLMGYIDDKMAAAGCYD